jgi:hypothetical protein
MRTTFQHCAGISKGVDAKRIPVLGKVQSLLQQGRRQQPTVQPIPNTEKHEVDVKAMLAL